jgi:hypothetical protein
MKFLHIILILFTLTICLPSHAKLSCNDLDVLAESLDEFAEEFKNVSDHEIDRSLDRTLRELVVVLKQVANVEKDKRLSAWIQNLEIAWEDEEREDFDEAIDDIIERLDDLYDRDCD